MLFSNTPLEMKVFSILFKKFKLLGCIDFLIFVFRIKTFKEKNTSKSEDERSNFIKLCLVFSRLMLDFHVLHMDGAVIYIFQLIHQLCARNHL